MIFLLEINIMFILNIVSQETYDCYDIELIEAPTLTSPSATVLAQKGRSILD
jgi:hypothetical protein